MRRFCTSFVFVFFVFFVFSFLRFPAAYRPSSSSSSSESPPISWYSSSSLSPSSSSSSNSGGASSSSDATASAGPFPPSSVASAAAPSSPPAARSASTSAAWLSHMRCCERGAMSLMNSVSFGSAAMASSISFSKASFFARFIFLSSRTPMNRSASAALASRAARSSGVSCVLRCAEDPSECLLHGRGSCADLTALAYSTCTLLVSMKVLWKYSSALTASAVVLYPTKAIWRDLPSLEMVRRGRRRRRRRRQRGVRGRGHGGRRG